MTFDLPHVAQGRGRLYWLPVNRPRNASDPALALLQSATAETLACMSAPRLVDSRVHAARKALKKARAALRLLRPMLGDAVYVHENLVLRDAGRCLSPLRDAKSLLGALDSLESGSVPGTNGIKKLRQALQTRRMQARRDLADPGTRRRCAQLVRDCRERVQSQPWSVKVESELTGLRKIYRKGRETFALAWHARTPEALHEWRKQTKYLQSAAQALRDAGARHLRKVVERSGDVAEALGHDHDFATLRAEVARVGMTGKGAAVLIMRIDERRAKLQHRAFAVGVKLFSRKPKKFVTRLLAPKSEG
jgi:CHAD domain-containing protein